MAGTTATQQVPVRRTWDPLAPVGTAGGLKALLESQAKNISTALPKHVTAERLIKTLLVAANRIPDLLQCTQSSILETINRAAELGLDLSGTLGEAYPVPFNNRVKVNGQDTWVKQCQLIIGYRGFEKLAWQSGQVEHIDSEVVCQNDKFVFKKGTEVVVEWEPAMSDRGEPIGVYACAKFKNGGKIARFLTVADVEKIRSGSKSKDSPAWKNWWDEMARAKAIKRMLKDAPLSTEKYVEAIEHDDTDIDLLNVEEVTRVGALPDGRKNFGMRQQQRDTAPENVDTTTGEVAQQQEQPETAQTTRQTTQQQTTTEPEQTQDEPQVDQQGNAGGEQVAEGATTENTSADPQQQEKEPEPAKKEPPIGERPIDKMTQLSSIDAVIDSALTLPPAEFKLSPLQVKQQILVAVGGPWAKATADNRTKVISALKQGTFVWKPVAAAPSAK